MKTWNDLMSGNAKFVNGYYENLTNLETLREKLATEGQKPTVAVLSCADSRVPPEIIFQKTLGELFVVRIAGNIATSEAIASLEFAIKALGVKMILILGHSKCGAIQAAITHSDSNGQVQDAKTKLEKMVIKITKQLSMPANACLDEAIEKNVLLNSDILLAKSSLIEDSVKSGDVILKTAVYDIQTGKVNEVFANNYIELKPIQNNKNNSINKDKKEVRVSYA